MNAAVPAVANDRPGGAQAARQEGKEFAASTAFRLIPAADAASTPIRVLRRPKPILAIAAVAFALCLAFLTLAARADAHVYWANLLNDTIGRADLDGANPDQSFITGANNPTDVAVDATHVYWTNLASGTVGRANLDGTNPNPELYHRRQQPLRHCSRR